MPESKRRSPASRPGRAGDSKQGRPRKSPAARQGPNASRAMPEHVEPIKRAIVESAEQRSDQRLGMTARRAAILAAVVCVLTLTIAGPVRTYLAQRAELAAIEASNAQLEEQKARLEAEKAKISDPAYVESQARDRLGMVMPGETPYQIQLPNAPSVESEQPGS